MTPGLPCHIDLTATDLGRSLAFYDKVLQRLGYNRVEVAPGNVPCWAIEGAGANPGFGIGVHEATSSRRHDRYSPGLHHLAFHAANRQQVDEFHRFLIDESIEILDPPEEYDYTPGYYAVFFSDPDGLKLELVHEPNFDSAKR